MSYEDQSFSSAIDKGTLDALAVDEQESTVTMVTDMFEEVSRVLKLGSRYIIISLLQDQVISLLVKHFSKWSVSVFQLLFFLVYHRMILLNSRILPLFLGV